MGGRVVRETCRSERRDVVQKGEVGISRQDRGKDSRTGK